MIDPVVKFLGDWLDDVSNIWTILIRLILAVIFGGIIGLERASKRHAAGFRTYILVCLGATLAMITNQFICEKSGQGDYARLGAQVISGIGFLGAGTILVTSKNQIKGLTTSVGLWASGILGLVIGTGYYTIVLFCFITFLCVLSLIPPLEIYLKNHSNHFEIHLELKNYSYLKDFTTVIRELGLRIDDIEANTSYINSGLSVYSVSLSILNNKLKEYKTHNDIINALKSLDYIYYIEEM